MYIKTYWHVEHYFPNSFVVRPKSIGRCQIGIGINQRNGEEYFSISRSRNLDCWWVWVTNTWEISIIKELD